MGDLCPVLEVADLRVSVPGPQRYEILRGVSFALAPGEVFGLVGESGSGKTTTALALLGYARPGTALAGSIHIDGAEMLGRSEAAMREVRGHRVSYVPQDPTTALNPALRIGGQLEEMIAVGRRNRRRADLSRIPELLDKVRLPSSKEFLRRYPHQLSGGQQQRVCIAMAMINRPRVIIFDEPTTGLDVTTQGHVLETIRELIKSEGTAAVYVTHDLAVVSEIATRVAVMYDGLIVEEAPTRAVLSQAAHPYTKRLVLSTPSVTRRRELVGIPGKPLNPKERPTGCPFAARCTYVEPRCMDDLPALEVVDVDHRSRCLRSRFVRSDTTLSGLRSGSSWDGTAETGEAKAQPLLTLAGVYASYGQDPVLHEVDLSISEGECLALVGESGSGKTTLARCVIGIHPDTVEGYIGFGGSSLPWPAKSRAAAARREIQYIFQNPQGSLNPRHTIGEIVAEPLLTFDIADSAGERRARVRDLLSRVALPADYQYRYPNQLSGGERQRVAIARALAAQPRLLVCDEITSSLDVSIQASILELLGQLRNQSNLTILFITHNLGIVRAIADEIVILEHGVIVERGPAERTLDAPAHPYTRELLANTPVMADVGAES